MCREVTNSEIHHTSIPRWAGRMCADTPFVFGYGRSRPQCVGNGLETGNRVDTAAKIVEVHVTGAEPPVTAARLTRSQEIW